jgi:hypothetical protein
MSRIPGVATEIAVQHGPVDTNELGQLEAQREELLAMVTDQAKRMRLLVPGIMIGLAVLVFFGVRSGEMALPAAVLTLVIVVSLLFVFRRNVRVFADLIYTGQPDARELLADCEAQISRVRERRS